MGIIAKFAAIFTVMPASVLGGMQVFLFSTITVAGVRVLGMVEFTRRNRFMLIVALAFGFIDIVTPTWFDRVIEYKGSSTALQGLLEGVELTITTPFILAAVLGVFLNAVLPSDTAMMDTMLLKANRSL